MSTEPSTPPTTGARYAVVIGAGSGLGRSLALRFAAEGHDIALLARNTRRLEDLAAEVRAAGRDALVVGCDASDLAQLHAAVTEVAQAGAIEVLAYNASAFGERLIDADLDALQQATNLSVLGPVAAVQAALPSLRATGGTVLLTGGGLALKPYAPMGVLSLGKAGMRTVAGLLADDLAEHGVRVRTLIINGTIEAGTAFDPEHIADAFWAFHTDPGDEVERVFDGAS